MGKLLNTSNNVVNSSLELIDNMLNSPFNKFLNETPLLVEYYNINDIFSTTDTGLGTIDEQLGENSPTRFNKIKDFPIYGLKSLIPDVSEIDGELLDISIDGEVTVLPNTIRPTPGDYFTYKFLNRTIAFIINEVNLTTIQSNSYYKLQISMKAIDDFQYGKKLDTQVVETFNTDLETVGTNSKCIIKSTLFDRIKKLEDYVIRIKDAYKDCFYSPKYNSIILRNTILGEVNLYDQYLTQFIQNNSILDMVIVNYDTNYKFRKTYNQTLFRNIETREKSSIKKLLFSPSTFPNPQNPFTYYGEELFYCLELYEDEFVETSRNKYMSHKLINDIISDIDSDNNVDNIIINYMNTDILSILSDEDEEILSSLDIDDSYEDFYRIPILIYIMERYIETLKRA